MAVALENQNVGSIHDLTKRGQQKDIDKAKALHHEYKVRKKAKSATSKTQ